MRGTNGVKFFTIIIIIGLLTWITIFSSLFGLAIPGAKEIRTGTDIRGGVSATLAPPAGVNPTDNQIATAQRIIEQRLDNLGIFDRTVTPEKVNKRIILEIPWKSGETEFNPQKTIDETIQMAELTFQEVDETKKDKDGNYAPTDIIVLHGKNVKDAGVIADPSTGEMMVSLKLDSEGTKKFAEATQRLIGKPIAIFMDGKPVLDTDKNINSHAPMVNDVISGGEATINGQKDAEEAGKLAAIIRSGNLPFKMEAIEVNSISPMLGSNALDVSIYALITALILVSMYMLLYYRLPGILATIALLGHTVIQVLFISWLGITVTLPGIAGIILSIGMGVDANVIIFERIKEELRMGKTLRAAIDVGFKRAFAAVFDANMTTLIAAVMLYVFGTGPIKSFGITMGLGVALSFLTAVTASRIMLKSVADLNIAKHPWLYGVKTVKEAKEVRV